MHPSPAPPLEIACNLRNPLEVPVIRRILVVVDPTEDSQLTINKAARIALALGSVIELYVCDVEQSPAKSPGASSDGVEFRELRKCAFEDELDRYAEGLRTRGLCVTTHCEWHAPLTQGIGYHVLRTKPDLVVKASPRHAAMAHDSRARTDWTLINQLPVPLLLVRAERWPDHPGIAVSVDPCHVAERPPSLDRMLVSLGCLFANGLAGKLEAWHVLEAPPHLPGESVAPIDVARASGAAHDAVEAVVGLANNMPNAIPAHFLRGPVAQALAGFAHARKPDLLVLGVAARPRWTDSAASGTAAQLLEQIDSDLLVVKPEGFVSPLLVHEES
jgi:universal stress protein E